MPDIGHERTDELLDQLERRIAKVYRQAWDEMEKYVIDYFTAFEKRDIEMREMIGQTVNGKIWTEKDYTNWRLTQIARGERIDNLAVKLAERFTKANEVTAAYINDATPGVYSLNRNYTAYTIEQVGGNVGFTLLDENTVKRLLKEEPDLMPYYPPKRAVKRGIDLEYGQKKVKESVTSGILQGKSLSKIADDIQASVSEMNRNSAIRAARTAFTSAENGGRMDSYKAAEDMGINVRKRWVATKDGRTRHSHRRLDGQTVGWDKPFTSELGKIRFPGDPRAKPANTYNCRCTLRTVEKPGIEAEPRKMRVRDPKTGRNVLVNEMTYDEWERWKKSGIRSNQVTTMSQAKIALTESVGFDAVESSFDKIDEKLAVAATNQLQNLENKFGVVKKSSGTICSVADGRTEAYVRSRATDPTSQNLSLCPTAYKNYSEHVKTQKSQIKSKWAMPAIEENYDIYTVTHEYGHMLQNTIIKKAMEEYGLDKLKSEINIKAKTAKAMFKPYKKIQDSVGKKCFSEIVEIAKEKNPRFSLSDNISNYGKSNYFEFFAEVFANSQLGAPNELGKAMNEWLLKKGLMK